MKAFAITIFFLSIYVLASAQTTGTFTDSRDGHTYKTIKIGDQVWLAENFAYKPEQGNFWTVSDESGSVSKYGYLYDKATAKAIVPPGWHLPTKGELDKLVVFAAKGPQKEGELNFDDEIMDIDKKALPELLSGGKSGFNAVYTGIYGGGGRAYLNIKTAFWSAGDLRPARENAGTTAALELSSESGTSSIMFYSNSLGISVRLVKD